MALSWLKNPGVTKAINHKDEGNGNDILKPNTTHMEPSSGAYDFGYLIKILVGRALPTRMEDFLDLLHIFFGPRVFDMKYMMRFCNGLYGGLERVAGALEVQRDVEKAHGPAPTACSYDTLSGGWPNVSLSTPSQRQWLDCCMG
ncbi:hypothetical protein SAY87_009466 [Trapa incisa]|uniref:Uncharacterized protein n=1 Tax=Trapa incisa TaxID=236973 RepID=A0AAN7JYE4_9MYRT|nr:hypothetical protein SAY87_009466 [Trapa incisa]